MKLGSLKSGRDGRLVVVSQDLAWCADASHIAPTLQAALDDWDAVAPQLELLATDLAHEAIPMMRFHERQAAAPLPRAFEWLDGPITRLAPPDVPAMPYATPLEDAFMLSTDKIVTALRGLAAYCSMLNCPFSIEMA